MAMRAQPDGFPRYRDKADVLSALVNKALYARGLRPELEQSLYSLRHTFEDRLTAVDAPDKTQVVQTALWRWTLVRAQARMA